MYPEEIMSPNRLFVHDALERHRRCIELEAAANTEREKMRAFVDFIAAECAIRREQYKQFWSDEDLDLDLLKDQMFGLVARSPEVATHGERRISGIIPPQLVALSNADGAANRPESAWWSNYQPCLSPIASMSMNDDEMSSRGRTSSRWWESATGSDGVGRKIVRSKRESKYMGLSHELLQEEDRATPLARRNETNSGQQSHFVEYGPDEYPPEKVGWHEDSADTPPAPYPPGSSRQLAPPEPEKVDFSRLVTLPPPYPRHHPAVNNSHPALASPRAVVRSVTDTADLDNIRTTFTGRSARLRSDSDQRRADNRKEFRMHVQRQIEEGTMSYAEAAEAESVQRVDEQETEKELLKADFDSFQTDVVQVVHEALTERINKTTQYIEHLHEKLVNDARQPDPNQTQEEGDEQPELMETLTQLKWLFEAREQLHRDVYNLLSERNAKYEALVKLPYAQSSNTEKLREAERFFARDAQDRLIAFEKESLRRHEGFTAIVEDSVVRGVEVQLSAFWDIAPSLLDVIHKVPSDLRNLHIQIPQEEYAENPSYHTFPLQYLSSLLSHAGKSTYQFIESQTNLLCLLHEVKSGTKKASSALKETQRIAAGAEEGTVRKEMIETRHREERLLTEELKENVGVVDKQWEEALGGELERLQGRVKDWLVGQGGWEDDEE